LRAARLHIPAADWSSQDQEALARACTPGLRRLGGGRAVRWRPDTLKLVIEGVGHYLGFLSSLGISPKADPLSALTTEDRVLGWIAAMRSRNLTPYSLHFRVAGLLHGCQVMSPSNPGNG
jgi:hypothetical protein